jgi:hypothetical protein
MKSEGEVFYFKAVDQHDKIEFENITLEALVVKTLDYTPGSVSFFVNGSVKAQCCFLKPVDLRSRRVDSCGRSWTDETPQERSDEEAQRQPRGKRSAWNENQQPCLTEPCE